MYEFDDKVKNFEKFFGPIFEIWPSIGYNGVFLVMAFALRGMTIDFYIYQYGGAALCHTTF